MQTLKSRIHAGELIHQIRLANHATASQVEQAIHDTQCYLIYIDAQHVAISEWDIVRIFSATEAFNVPVQMRIRHLKEVYLIRHYLDLGLLGIKVPEVKDAATVTGAVNAFFFPHFGHRSWGGWVN